MYDAQVSQTFPEQTWRYLWVCSLSLEVDAWLNLEINTTLLILQGACEWCRKVGDEGPMLPSRGDPEIVCPPSDLNGLNFCIVHFILEVVMFRLAKRQAPRVALFIGVSTTILWAPVRSHLEMQPEKHTHHPSRWSNVFPANLVSLPNGSWSVPIGLVGPFAIILCGLEMSKLLLISLQNPFRKPILPF